MPQGESKMQTHRKKINEHDLRITPEKRIRTSRSHTFHENVLWRKMGFINYTLYLFLIKSRYYNIIFDIVNTVNS